MLKSSYAGSLYNSFIKRVQEADTSTLSYHLLLWSFFTFTHIHSQTIITAASLLRIFAHFDSIVMDGPTDGQTDGWTNGRTDKASYRDACLKLKSRLMVMKMMKWKNHDLFLSFLPFFWRMWVSRDTGVDHQCGRFKRPHQNNVAFDLKLWNVRGFMCDKTICIGVTITERRSLKKHQT